MQELREYSFQQEPQKNDGRKQNPCKLLRVAARLDEVTKLTQLQLEAAYNDQASTSRDGSQMTLKRGRFELWRMLNLFTKFITIVFSTIILVFYVEIYQWVLVYGSAPQMVLPFVVCSSYMIITGAMGLAKFCRKKFPTYLAMTFDVQGAFLFCSVGAICFMCWEKAQGKEIIGPAPIHMPSWINRRAILVSAILGWANSVIYVLDAMLAYRDRWKHS